ncbi:hypothetical protein AAG570_013075 [Ranatra chinensis]|uniref:Cytochrome P450 n=1 Tax=Ranatra chinensis TaxID=642074 RepID=A0ABD0YS68_9HEMI
MAVAALLSAAVAARGRRLPPGPAPWPLLGSLHLLAGHSSPFAAFSRLGRRYGPVFLLRLGTAPCVVVTSLALVKEVLVTKGAHFGGRPDFLRYHALFGGDRNNSMALCDWSILQKKRRSIARMYCSPRFSAPNYEHLSQVGVEETQELVQALSSWTRKPLDLKPLLLAACGNMFTGYMCSTRFDYQDEEFVRVVRYFDQIFWEINQGYAVDFMPWLRPVYRGHLKKLSCWAHDIRKFILTRIIEHHRATLDLTKPPRDFTDALLIHLEEDPDLDWEHIIFELEDFLGGHSAIGNLAMLVFAAVIKNPEVGKKIQEEVDMVIGDREITLFDRVNMPYTEATLLEALRTSSSPIVPHVATQDTTIADYDIPKGTVVFLNNFELNTGSLYWEEPERFKPERFICESGQIVKPEHFIPFSTGKRTCIGQRLVQGFSFLIVGSILQKYDISSHNPEEVKTFEACVALPPDTFKIVLTERNLST